MAGKSGISVGGEIVTPSVEPRRGRRAVGWVALAGAVAFAVSVMGAMVWGSRHVSEVSEGRIFEADTVPALPVAMVLGASAEDGRPSEFLAARLDLALALFNRGKIRAVLVSGDNRAASDRETSVMRDYLVERGIPSEQVVEDPAGYDTYDSCVRARDVFGVEEMIILTQLYHLERAIAICTDIGIDAIGVGDVSTRERFPSLYATGERREQAANIKMVWDLLTRREPRQDPFDPALLKAAGE